MSKIFVCCSFAILLLSIEARKSNYLTYFFFVNFLLQKKVVRYHFLYLCGTFRWYPLTLTTLWFLFLPRFAILFYLLRFLFFFLLFPRNLCASFLSTLIPISISSLIRSFSLVGYFFLQISLALLSS